MHSIQTLLAVMAMAGTAVNAHMVMAEPTPYGSPNNSPLVADGSDFPCKTPSNAGATVNKLTIGVPQPLKFTGGATHGGGSCQISLTKDMPAKKSSTWMVIHSIEGGCPAKNTNGNIGENAGAPDPDVYSFTVPDGIAPGGYTLAWTWFNKVGNREMYMNCASVQIAGGSKKRENQHPRDFSLNETFSIPELNERAASFPNMFVANIPSTNCLTADSADLQFPDPGTSVEKDGTGQLTPPTGPQCSAGPAAAGGGSGSSSSGSGAGAGAGSGAGAGAGSGSGAGSGAASPSSAAGAGGAASSPAAAAPSAPASPVASGGSAAPSAPVASAPYANASSGAVAAPSSAGSGAAPAAPSAAAAPAAPSGGASASSGSGAAPAASSGNGVCTSAGASVCSPDGKQIGTCTADMTVTFMPVADGTKCSGGMMVMAGSKKVKARSAYDPFGI